MQRIIRNASVQESRPDTLINDDVVRILIDRIYFRCHFEPHLLFTAQLHSLPCLYISYCSYLLAFRLSRFLGHRSRSKKCFHATQLLRLDHSL